MKTAAIIFLSVVIVYLINKIAKFIKLVGILEKRILVQEKMINNRNEIIKIKNDYIDSLLAKNQEKKQQPPSFIDSIFGLFMAASRIKKADESVEEQIKKALVNEDYELAAKLRDQLNKGKDAQSN